MKIKNILLLMFFVLFFIMINFCKESEGSFFYVKSKQTDNNIKSNILEDLISKNKQKKRDAIRKVKEHNIIESKQYLKDIILDSNELLNDRLLATNSYASIFKEESINLAHILTLDYEYNNISVAIELIFNILNNDSLKVNTNELQEQFGNFFLSHFRRATSFTIKSKTMLTLAYLNYKEIIPLIKDTITFDNPILGETAIALSRLIIDETGAYYGIKKNDITNTIKDFIIKTNDDNLRRLLRRALHILENKEEIPIDILYTISDLGSTYFIISIKAEEEIKKNIAKYKDALFSALYDIEDNIKYRASYIISAFPFPKDCEIISTILNDSINNKLIKPENNLYIPIQKNIIIAYGKAKCGDGLLLKNLISKDTIKDSVMVALTYDSPNILIENNIEIIPIKNSTFNVQIFDYLYENNKFDTLIGLLKNENKTIVYGAILYLKKSFFNDKYEKIKQIQSTIEDEKIKQLIKEHLIKEEE